LGNVIFTAHLLNLCSGQIPVPRKLTRKCTVSPRTWYYCHEEGGYTSTTLPAYRQGQSGREANQHGNKDKPSMKMRVSTQVTGPPFIEEGDPRRGPSCFPTLWILWAPTSHLQPFDSGLDPASSSIQLTGPPSSLLLLLMYTSLLFPKGGECQAESDPESPGPLCL